jgi:hypothetical protein
MPLIIISIIVFIGMMAYRAYRAYGLYTQPHNAFADTAKAELIRKETHVSTQIDANGTVASEEIYQLVFSLAGEGEMSFRVSRKAYENTPEGERGTLTYQGEKFLGFEFVAGDSL